MTGRASPRIAVVALAVAVPLLVASIVWAAASAGAADEAWSGGRVGPGMMAYAPADGRGARVGSIDAARRQAERLADRLELSVGEVMEFDNHFYAELVDHDNRPATEVLVDPRTGAVAVEPGPAMMWNTRYGMMSGGGYGMMGGMPRYGRRGFGAGGPMGAQAGMAADPTWPGDGDRGEVTARDARALAAGWLRQSESGLSAGDVKPFPGYFTVHTLRDGRVTGMLSVSASTGAVWPHWWHGRLVRISS